MASDALKGFEELRKLEALLAVASSPQARAFKAHLRQVSEEERGAHLMLYCEDDLLNLLRCTLAVGAPPDWRDVDGLSPLSITAMNGSLRCMSALLDAGADASLGN